MEDCTRYAPLISAAVDGEVSPEERRDLMDHLAQCPACRGAYEEMLAMHMAFGELDAEVPGDLAGDVMAEIRSRQKKPRRRYWLQVGMAAACCALVFLGYRALGPAAAGNAAPTAADTALTGTADTADDAAATVTARVQSEEDVTAAAAPEDGTASDEEILESVLTYFQTAPKATAYTSTENSAQLQTAPDVLTAPADSADAAAGDLPTISSSDQALADWMEGNTSAKPYTQEGVTAWLIPLEQYEALERFLAEEAVPYSMDCVQLVEEPQAQSGEMACVVYLDIAQEPTAP